MHLTITYVKRLFIKCYIKTDYTRKQLGQLNCVKLRLFWCQLGCKTSAININFWTLTGRLTFVDSTKITASKFLEKVNSIKVYGRSLLCFLCIPWNLNDIWYILYDSARKVSVTNTKQQLLREISANISPAYFWVGVYQMRSLSNIWRK